MSLKSYIKNYLGKYFGVQVLPGLKNASFLTTGQIITQLIGLIGVPLIARKLGVEQYGILTTVTAFVGMFALINLKGTGRVLVREGSKDLNKLPSYIENIIGIKNVFALLSILVTIIVGLFIKSYTAQIKVFIVIYSITHIFEIYNSFFGTIYQAFQKMQYISYFSIARKVLYTVSAILAVYLGSGVLTLILINIISNVLVLILNYKKSKTIISFKIFRPIQWKKELMVPSIVFSLIGVLGFFQTKIDIVMISWMGTAREVGIYAVAFKIVHYIMMIKNQASIAFFPIFVKRFNEGPVRLSKLIKLSLILFLAAAGFATIFSFFAKDIIVLIFGIEYHQSGYIISILLFYIAFGFMYFPFGNAFLATGNEKINLVIGYFPPVANVILNYFLYQKFGLIGIAYSTLIVMSTFTLIGIGFVIYFLKKQGRLI